MVGKFILLVEDNADDEALTLRAMKANNILVEIVVVRDGAEALDFIFGEGIYMDRDASILPRLVLLDLKLPKLDGLEVLKRLQSEECTRHLPVVVLTSSNEDEDVLSSYSLGANSYIRKPVDSGQFGEAMSQLSAYWLVLNTPPPEISG